MKLKKVKLYKLILIKHCLHNYSNLAVEYETEESAVALSSWLGREGVKCKKASNVIS